MKWPQAINRQASPSLMFLDGFNCKPVQGRRPLCGALKILPEVKLDGELGGSITIECPLPKINVRMYLCREMVKPAICSTVVSNNFIKKEYDSRVTLKPCLHKNLFLVEMTELTESDSGVYACGVGTHTERGKTQKVTLNVHSEYNPFWEEELISEPPKWFHKFLEQRMPTWLQMVAHASSSESTSKVITPTQRTDDPPEPHPSPTTPIIHHPRESRAFSVAAAKPSTVLPSTTTSKTSTQEGLLRPPGASYKQHTRLHGQREFNRGSEFGREDQGFHILIPTVLGLLLLALLGLVVKRAIQRKRAFSRRVRRMALRMRALEASQRPREQRPRSQRPRSQNIYSACPRRAPESNAAGQRQVPPADPGTSAPSAPPQVLEAPWLHTPSLKTSCEYMSICHQPAVKREDTESNDYINIPSLTHPPSCTPAATP
ncbi:fas apoptotic inhibitory molecule 3 isoform X1 [Marmota marmota marmota]|uniref:fas apoptotic inhibitory molecule 3 isoform X1 n=2 Tax=Marmota TaxID=9992 RepID=UPI002093B592|nr:fas apoptotic inhibitory molecule 3 isoform X1 [Marmota marmota marmota]